MKNKIERIISISDESPHEVSNGYNLRVNKLLVNAARRGDVDVHCIAPITHNITEKVKTWANSQNLTIHGVVLHKEMLWDKKLRTVFRKECAEILSNYVTENSLVMIHGVNSIIDFADLNVCGHLVADLIDETSPHMMRNMTSKLVRGQLVEFLRTIKYLVLYHSKMKQLADRYKKIIVVAHDDALRLKKIIPGKEISILPNGVEIPSRLKSSHAEKCPNVLFHGVYGYYPNEEAALFLIRKVAPELKKECPHLKVIIVGRNPTKRMLEAGHLQSNVNVCGEVNELSDYLLNASVGAYPIFTRTGIQNKILEAWAHGLPVVTTPGMLSVFEKFSEDARYCALSATTNKDFALKCALLHKNCDVGERLSAKASEFIASHFDWQKTVEQLIQLV